MQSTEQSVPQAEAIRRKSPPKSEKPVSLKGVVARESKLKTRFTANFSEMVLINFEVDTRLLKQITPKGLEPDLYQGKAHISLIAKTIRGLKFKGLLLCRDFASVGLQLYVKEPHQGGYRYGTFFLKHYVQRSFPAWLMSKLTHSEVSQIPIRHKNSKVPVNRPPDIEYLWKVRERWNDIRIRGRSRVKEFHPEGKIAYILRHADRYTVNESGVWRSEMSTPGWVIWDVAQAKFDCDVEHLFGSQFVKAMSKRPTSVFLSRGNRVSLSRPELVGHA